MKKIVLTTLAIVALSVSAFAQGVVTWNSIGGFVIGQTNKTQFSSFEAAGTADQLEAGQSGNTLGSGTTLYYYALLVAPNGTAAPTSLASLSSWQDTGLMANNAAASNGRLLQLNSGNAAVANNLAAGETKADILVGWSANLGTTWAQVLAKLQSWSTPANQFANAFFGVSAIGSLTGVASPGPGNQPFGVGAGQITATSPNQLQMNLLGTAVPEPGTLALAPLGGASLLLLRRKK